MPVLGCGEYTVGVVDRDTGLPVSAAVPWTSGSWSRADSDTSTAELAVGGLDDACYDLLQEVDDWTHELVVTRDRREVWRGPILTTGPSLAFSARDVSAYLDKRPIRRTLRFENADLGDVFVAIVEEAMRPDPRPRIVVTSERVGVKGTRSIPAGQHRIARSELNELARTAVSWTVVGRELRVGRRLFQPDVGQEVPLLEDADFATTPDVQRFGTAQATTVGVRGGGQALTESADDPIYAEATDDDAAERYGFLYALFTEDTILDEASALASAKSRLATLARPVTIITSGTLAPTAAVDLDQLLPGTLVDVRTQKTRFPVDARLRVKSVSVAFDASTNEAVTVEFASLVDVETTGL